MNEEQHPPPEPSQPMLPAQEENSPEATAPAPEKEIDLNVLFPDAEDDLNTLFQDEDMKLLLKSVSKNKKDLHTLKDRFLEENATDDDESEVEDSP